MKIAVLFPSETLSPFYSLTSVIESQLRMLLRHGHHPILLLREDCKERYQRLKGVRYRRCLPVFEYYRYKKPRLRKKDEPFLRRSIKALHDNLRDAEIAITHDLVNLECFYVYNLALRKAAEDLPRLRWLHWIHSVPYRTIPVRQKMKQSWLVIPNHHYRSQIARAFGYPNNKVATVYHPLDIFPGHSHPLTRSLIHSYGLLDADIVQLYPARTESFEYKQIDIVIKIFVKLKERGKRIRLIIANPFCVSERMRKKTKKWMRYARAQGLGKEEIIFTSDFQSPRWEKGIPREAIVDLFRRVTNLFVFPSLSEMFSLATMEAACGGNLLVLNQDLSFLKDLVGKNNALYFKFGGYDRKGRFFGIPSQQENRYLSRIADEIIKRIDQDIALRARRHVRRQLDPDRIYKDQLKPLLYRPPAHL